MVQKSEEQDWQAFKEVPKRITRTKKPPVIVAENPVAQIIIEGGGGKSKNSYEYLIPKKYAHLAVVGAKVRVTFNGKLKDGYLLGRSDIPTHAGDLLTISSIPTKVAPLNATLLALCQEVSDYYAAGIGQILTYAVPPRHGGGESEYLSTWQNSPAPEKNETDLELALKTNPLQNYQHSPAYLKRIEEGQNPKATWITYGCGATQNSWAKELTLPIIATLKSGRSAIIVLAKHEQVGELKNQLSQAGIGEEQIVELTSNLSAKERYLNYLRCQKPVPQVIIGLRSAAFAPSMNLGLLACYDDQANSHQDDHWPHLNTREVLLLRAKNQACALAFVNHTQSLQLQHLVNSGHLHELKANKNYQRAGHPLVRPLTIEDLGYEGSSAQARIPSYVHRKILTALQVGSVLIQVPRAGYAPRLGCQNCKSAAKCNWCGGTLQQESNKNLKCNWCNRQTKNWKCTECGGQKVRYQVLGAQRTAEEIGRQFSPHRIITSGRAGGIINHLEEQHSIVIATPGAEPSITGGYAAAIILDPWIYTAYPSIYNDIKTLHAWIRCAQNVRPHIQGGTVYLIGQGDPLVAGAFTRWDSAWLCERSLEERQELNLPPISRIATVTGEKSTVETVLKRAGFNTETEILGPSYLNSEEVLLAPEVKYIIKTPAQEGQRLGIKLRETLRALNLGGKNQHLKVELDPDVIF